MDSGDESFSASGTAGGVSGHGSSGPQPGDKTDGDLRSGGAPVDNRVRGSGERNGAISDGDGGAAAIRRDWWPGALAAFRRAVRLTRSEGRDIAVTVQPIDLRGATGRRVIVMDPMGMDDLRAAIGSARILVLGLAFLVVALAAYITRLRRSEDTE